ncbi:MBL fold metallo-hydrolase [Lichenihabitans psoromatis]|uniref:MBL fold metallo-hydrolase n=1 Tax=Lichenihabitans psoromatis TaxID=2528642 RepID=UPI0010385847|nr:MBL fold metallo-hydrolase [Lichenihabitans psoromatis]
MKITFYAHASFRLETPTFVIITDPYTPGRGGSGFKPIDELADLVLMSSATDRFHSDPSHILGDPTVVNAMDLPRGGDTVRGVHIKPFPTSESLTFDFGRDPDANAMSLFSLGGLRVLHMGDVGNAIDAADLRDLAGTVDIMLALVGAHATIGLDDLDAAIAAIGPKIVIPMHYWSPDGVLAIEPVETFLSRYPALTVQRIEGSSITIEPGSLPATTQIVVLRESR